MRIVIAGGGVIGLLTAVSSVLAGHRVLLLDQSGIPFPGAASFDRHRALRALHLDDPRLAEAAVRAHHRWTELEALLGVGFYQQVGALTVLSPGEMPGAHALLAGVGSPSRMIGPEQLAADYPHLRFPAGMGAVVEAKAGILLADQILAACADWLERHDRATVRPHCRVAGVDPGSPAVILARGERVAGDAVLLATGAWSRALLPAELAGQLVLHRQSMIYLDVPTRAAAAWEVTPSILRFGPAGDAWLIPPVSGTPLKFSAASACRVVTGIDGNGTPPGWRDHLLDVAAATIPGCDATWLAGTRDCYYLAHPSDGPALAVLGDRLLSYAACGGGSFKFAPLIADALAGRLTGADTEPTGLRWVDRELTGLRGVDGGLAATPAAAATPAGGATPAVGAG